MRNGVLVDTLIVRMKWTVLHIRFAISQPDCRIRYAELRLKHKSCLDDMNSLVMHVTRPLTVTIP
jgi:hypothetical protein